MDDCATSRCGQSAGPSCLRPPWTFSVSGHLRVDAEMGVVVHSRRWHQGGEVVAQVRWRQDLQATASGAPIGLVVAEALVIEFAQPFPRERWWGAITQQALTSGAVGGLDAYQGIDGTVAAAFPLGYRPRVVVLQRPATHEASQQLPACALLHRGDGGFGDKRITTGSERRPDV